MTSIYNQRHTLEFECFRLQNITLEAIQLSYLQEDFL
jgi:hypothetical protein